MSPPSQRVIESAAGRFSYGETGTGPTRLILHSLLTDRTAFDHVADSMGGRVVTLDLPGFGSTDPASPNIDDYARHVADFIDVAGLDAATLTLIGNGLGAFVALGTVINHSDSMARVILVGCGPAFPDQAKTAFAGMIESVTSGGMTAVVPTALRRIFTDEYLATHPEMARERQEILEKTDPAAFVTACRALIAMDYRLAARDITKPTLIVVGEDDQATPPALAEELHGLIGGSRLVQMAGVAHAPQLQDPEGFTAAIRTFLEET